VSTIIPVILALIQQLIPVISGAGAPAIISQILTVLTQVVPLLVNEYTALLPMVKNIIAALSANPAATADQLATLQTLDVQTDAAFEAAASAALAQDAAAASPSAPAA
jgi:phage-related protein